MNNKYIQALHNSDEWKPSQNINPNYLTYFRVIAKTTQWLFVSLNKDVVKVNNNNTTIMSTNLSWLDKQHLINNCY